MALKGGKRTFAAPSTNVRNAAFTSPLNGRPVGVRTTPSQYSTLPMPGRLPALQLLFIVGKSAEVFLAGVGEPEPIGPCLCETRNAIRNPSYAKRRDAMRLFHPGTR